MKQSKKVIYIIIDSFDPMALERCLAKDKVPALSYLIARGNYYDRCISVFPTVTPCCTSTLATGAAPDIHGIPGMVWYHRGERRVINYGSSLWSMYKNGVLQSATDMIFNLNQKHLGWQARTIYEDLEASGLKVAAVNPYIYRGNRKHSVHIPLILKLITLLELDKGFIYGPEQLCWGQLYQPAGSLQQAVKGLHYWSHFGVNDKFSLTAGKWFLQQKHRPDLLSLYFPDTDSITHESNVNYCDRCLIKFDKKLSQVLNSFVNWDKALEEYTFVIVGDHSQSPLKGGRRCIIPLPKLLKDYSQVKAGENPVENKDIAICANGRMAYLYILRYRPGMRKDIVKHLLTEDRIDQIIWKDENRYHVAGGGRETFCFQKGGKFKDLYGNQWDWEGDPAILDIKLEGNLINYYTYPNALERICWCLDNPNAGEFVVTAKPGYIIGGIGCTKFPGGSDHGTLHREDSLVPLIISETATTIENPRLVDIVPYIRSLLTSQGK